MVMQETKVNHVDREVCRRIREELNQAIAAVGEKFGMSAKSLHGTFSDNSFTVKVEFATLNSDGEAENKDAQNFRDYALLVGLNADMLFKTFEFTGDTYKIVGMKPARTKNSIVVEKVSNGKHYAMSPDMVKAFYK